MRTQASWKRVVTASMLVLAVGCRTPSAGLKAAGASDSGNSSAGDSSESGSGNSSQGDSSKSGSGNSSQGDSSRGDSSKSDSGNSSQGDSSKTDSGSSGSSDHSSAEGGSSHSGSSERSNAGTSESNQVEQGEDSRTRSESSNGRGDQLLSTATVALTVLGLGIVIWRSYVNAERRKGAKPSPKEVGHAAQLYLRARSHQLREDLALGAGPTVEDLAQAARIRRENLEVFGRLLRTHRQELLTMAEAKTLTPERARAWLERVGELARTEPRLEEDRQAFLQEQEGATRAAEALQ